MFSVCLLFGVQVSRSKRTGYEKLEKDEQYIYPLCVCLSVCLLVEVCLRCLSQRPCSWLWLWMDAALAGAEVGLGKERGLGWDRCLVFLLWYYKYFDRID